LRAIIVPIHPPSFPYAKKLIDSAKHLKSIDLFFIFSNLEDFNNFNCIYNINECSIKHIILDNFIISNSVITRKKWLALNIIFNKKNYDEAIVIDSECEILEENKLNKSFEDLKNRNYVNCVDTQNPNSNNIMRICQSVFSNEDRIILEKLFFFDSFSPYRTPSCRYFWFNDIPYYNKENFNMMLDYFDFFNHHSYINKLDSFWAFDYILYIFFASLKNKIIPISVGTLLNYPGSLVEQGYLFKDNVYKTILQKFESHWTSSSRVENELTSIKFHIDRFDARPSILDNIRGKKKLIFELYNR